VATKNTDIIGHFRSFCVAYQPRLNPILALCFLHFLLFALSARPAEDGEGAPNSDSFRSLRQQRHLADGKDLVGASRRQKHADKTLGTIRFGLFLRVFETAMSASEANLSAEALTSAWHRGLKT
jgi:hypothetical protein